MKTTWMTGFAAALAFGMGAMGPTQAANESVVIYSANDSVLNEMIFDKFTKETGIKVMPVAAGSGVLFKRITSEKNRPQGDIIWGVSRSLLETNKEHFAPYKSKHHDVLPAEYRDPEGLWTGTNLHILAILQNTDLLPADQGPKSWSDLLDPKWKGKFAFTDPANSGAAYANTTLLVDTWGGGEAGWKKVEQLIGNAKMLGKSSLVFQGVGMGEYPVGMSFENPGFVWAKNGAPVKVIYPEEGNIALMEGVAVIKGGPNTEAAKAFVDFIGRKDIREMILKETFRRPARPDIEVAKFAPGMKPMSELKMLPYDEEKWTEARSETLDKIRGIMERQR